LCWQTVKQQFNPALAIASAVGTNNMKTQITIILLLIFNNCFAQVSSDYKIYTTIIEDYFLQHDSARIHVDNAVIIDQLDTLPNWAAESYDYIDYAIFTNTIDTLTKNIAKQMLVILKTSYNNPVISIDSFKCSIPLHLIKNSDFKGLFAKRIHKAWDRFYKKYPRAIGAFGFTKVIYSGDLAILFVDFQRYGLAASGDVYIMRKVGDKWIIFNKFNIYQA
jgi:hypothetical protein